MTGQAIEINEFGGTAPQFPLLDGMRDDLAPERVGLAEIESDAEKQEELRLGRELREARAGLAALLLELPGAARDYVLEGDLEGPHSGHRWPLAQLETSFERLVLYAAANDDPDLAQVLDRARTLKVRVDRARETLVVANLGIVPYIVKSVSKGGIPFGDLVQDGNVGLLRAVERFDPDRGYRFATYAYWWVRRSLSEAFTNHARLIRLPDSLCDDLKKLRAATRELEEKLDRSPLPQELAAKMKVSLKKVKKLQAVVPEPKPLEDIGTDQDEGWSSLLPESTAPDPLGRTLDLELQEQTQQALGRLDSRERAVIELRFGFDDGEGRTLSQIGKVLGLSRERVRQIERIALDKIQAFAVCVGMRPC